MATLSELADVGVVHRISVSLDDGELAWRSLYGSPQFVDWLIRVLPGLETGIVSAPLTPLEQVDALFHQYLVGEPFIEDRRFRALSWTPDLHVWEFKTPDIRIFGWFVAMNQFVCTFGDHKDEIVRRDKVGRYIVQTHYFREHLTLDEPKAITFREYANVLSNTDR